MSTPSPELQQVIRDLEAALGEETLAKGRLRVRLEIAQFLTSLLAPLLLALLWLPTGWAVSLRNALQANSTWWRTWLAVAVFAVSSRVFIHIPLAWFFEFRTENLLGTNRQTLGGWLGDEARQAAIDILTLSLLYLGLYLVFRHWPHLWLLGMSVIVILFVGILVLISPWLMRMQNKAEPLDDPELTARLRQLFEHAGVPFGNISVLKTSEKSSTLGASLVPKGAGTEVVVTDTLLEAMTPEEVADVVAHELGHKVHHDWPKSIAVLGFTLIVTLAAGYWAVQALGHWDGLQGATDVATLPILMLAVSWGGKITQAGINAYLRRTEYAADRFALETTHRPDVFEKVMVMLARQNQTLPQPPAWIECCLRAHPSTAKRVLMARQWGKQHGGSPPDSSRP